jgi:hypothetical protein
LLGAFVKTGPFISIRREAKVFLFVLIFSVVVVLKFLNYASAPSHAQHLHMIELAERFGKTLGFYVLGRSASDVCF